MATVVEQFKQQAPRMLREQWRNSNELAQEIFAVLTSLVEPSAAAAAAAAAAAGGDTVRRLNLTQIQADHLVCDTLDGAETFNVARPPILRRTPFDEQTVDGISYVYSANTSRRATAGTDFEDQVIIPRYREADDQIFAIYVPGGTGVKIGAVPVLWLDLNVDARAWARVLPA